MKQTRQPGDFPLLKTAVPGPRSRALARRLGRVESANVTFISADWPVFLAGGDGAFLIDADGNRLLDMTGCFAVSALGHGPTAATAAGADQFARLAHAMGDVHPADLKVALLERLAKLAPFPRAKVILGCNGADAVESALKTARLATGKPGVIAFSSGYHGLGYGALAVCGWDIFRQPWADQVGRWGRVVPYPDPYRLGAIATRQAIAGVERLLRTKDVGAVIVEPILGRGGHIVPPDDFLPALRRLCDRAGLLLIADEIYTGMGRTGRLWACRYSGVAPDILLAGKALGGGFPISACIGNERAMAAWPASDGEALHTHTFLGHPVGCGMALEAISRIVADKLPARAGQLGRRLLHGLVEQLGGWDCVGDIRGRGLMVGVELVVDRKSKRPAGGLAVEVMKACLKRGLIVLTGGQGGNVICLSPPLTVTEGQIGAAVDILADALCGSGR